MNIKNKWNQFACVAVIIFAVGGTFLMLPAELHSGPDLKVEWLIKFLITCLVALFTIPLLKRSKKSDYTFWYRFAWISICCTVLIVGSYVYLVTQWSIPYYYNKRLIIGETMTPEAKQQQLRLAKEMNRSMIDIETLVKARRGETQYIWPSSELYARFFWLLTLYILSFLLVAIFMTSIIQSIYCYEKDS